MNKIIKFEELRKRTPEDSSKKIESHEDFKRLYKIDCNDDEFAMQLRSEKRKEKGLKWD